MLICFSKRVKFPLNGWEKPKSHKETILVSYCLDQKQDLQKVNITLSADPVRDPLLRVLNHCIEKHYVTYITDVKTLALTGI